MTPVLTERLKEGDFFRCFDGPGKYQFGRCRQHDDKWLRVEFFGNRHPQWPREPRLYRVTYPLATARKEADAFLAIAEIWP